MDFMNLNQAAHGDREFGYIQTRLGMPRTPSPATSPIRPCSRIAGWNGPPAGGRRCVASSWPASATTCATSP